MAIDLINVFFSILIRKEDHKQFRFTWNKYDVYRHLEFCPRAQ